ncbi:hypothetical protein JTE90_003905 [Oedothorax gibbosus]|uniref:Uncharacterized protein n=1 Tax=Oedothorax gibbosus TaxID=931172 RepID=A0AAV6UJ78_9ARAC|nr:hypothetical protein JTE90_003905 [Oedothorax gibbosus]
MDTYPKLRDLSFLQTMFRIPIGENWQIPVMKDDDVLWSIVLAYLNSFPESNKNELDRHVVNLLGKKVGRDVKKNVEKCNPFLYNNACFGNETLNDMVETLREDVEDHYRANRSHFWIQNENYKCLQASAILLSCTIILCNESTRIIYFFPDFFLMKDNRKILVIFENSCANGSSFSFCVPKDLGFRKQKLALHEILAKIKFAESERNITPVINTICSLPGKSQNFIISLLESDVAEYIPLIYKSPYILSKLRDAALETDPTIENGEGKSALFYALTNNQPRFLYFLYDHAANACLLTDGSVRSPDSVIVGNLMHVQEILINLKSKVESFDIDANVKKNSLLKLSELGRFNNFQIDVCRSINIIRSPFIPLSKVCEAEERRNVIMNILRNYEKYFEWNAEVSAEEFLLFYEFFEHGHYYDNLDFCSAVMFFDNLYLLKERLKLSGKTYLEIESRFFFFIYRKKYFESIVEKSFGLHLVSRMIIFQERLSLKTYLRSFKEALENELICESNTVGNLPDSEVRTLTNIPQIYSEFLVLRLKHYLKAAASIELIDFKAVLILQRTLQVIGECVKESDFKSVQKVFSLIIPEELRSILKQIRNELVHPTGLNFSYRISAEKDYELFNEIRNEIRTIESIFNPIFCAQNYEMEQFAISLAKIDVDKARSIKIPDLHKPKLILLLATDGEPFTNGDNFEDTWIKLFEELSSYITSSFSRDEQVINKGSILQLKYVFENAVNILKKKVSFMKSKCNNVRASFDCVDDYFFSMEYIFAYLIVQDKKLKNDLKRKVISKIQERKTLFRNTLANEQANENAAFQRAIENILPDYEQTIQEIFLETNCKPKKNVQFTFEHIKKFKKILKGNYYINGTEKKNILKNIPVYVMTTLEIKSKIKNFLEGKGSLHLNKKEFGEEIDKLPLKPREKRELLDDFGLENTKNSLLIINSVLRNFYPELQDAISKNELNDKKQYEDICNGLKLPDSSRDILRKIIKGKKWDAQEKGLYFLRNRIKQLKAIFIDDDASIKKLWESALSTRRKSYVQERLVHVYLNDPGTQAAVEMLLFDCMIILKTTDLKDLCRKTTNLFNGINLRNVLAHGNPLLESLGRLLDPRDLPSELVRKMIDLISDLEVIDCMVDILDRIGHVFETFIQFMNGEEGDGLKEIREKIASCHNWEQYAKLIPRQQASTTASPSPDEPAGSTTEDTIKGIQEFMLLYTSSQND